MRQNQINLKNIIQINMQAFNRDISVWPFEYGCLHRVLEFIDIIILFWSGGVWIN